MVFLWTFIFVKKTGWLLQNIKVEPDNQLEKTKNTAGISLEIMDFINEFYFQLERQANQNNKKVL